MRCEANDVGRTDVTAGWRTSRRHVWGKVPEVDGRAGQRYRDQLRVTGVDKRRIQIQRIFLAVRRTSRSAGNIGPGTVAELDVVAAILVAAVLADLEAVERPGLQGLENLLGRAVQLACRADAHGRRVH